MLNQILVPFQETQPNLFLEKSFVIFQDPCNNKNKTTQKKDIIKEIKNIPELPWKDRWLNGIFHSLEG